MESLGETTLIKNRFINSNDSPVLYLKPVTLTFDCSEEDNEKEHDDLELYRLNKFEKRSYNEFQRRVEERKKRGFIGNEFTTDEATSKIFGPQAVDANAFLEHYWNTKASCLDAVEKERDLEVENFKNHPLFSPSWLIPLKRDIRHYLVNRSKVLKYKIPKGKEMKKKIMVSRIPVRVGELGLRMIKIHPNRSTYKRIPIRDFTFTGNVRRENRARSKIPVRITNPK